MKKLIAIILSVALTSTTTFASIGNVQKVFGQLEKDVTISNIDKRVAIEKAFVSLAKSGATINDIAEYVKLNSSESDYALFQEMVSMANGEISASERVNASELEFLMMQAMQMADINGSYYQGCASAQSAGSVLLAGAMVMGFLSLYYAGHIGDHTSCGTFSCTTYNIDEDASSALGIAALFSFFFAIPLFAVEC